MKEKKSKIISIIYILLAGILWGCMGLFVRPLNERGLSSWDIVFIRAALTTVCMGIFLAIYNRSFFRIRLKDVWCFLGTGLASIVFFNLCYFKEITITTLSVAAILLYTAPAFVMLLSAVCFKEKITGIKIVSLVLTFAGLIFVTGVVGDSGNIGLKAVIIGLGAGLGYALYSIFGRYALDRGYDSLTISFYTFLFATVGTVFFIQPANLYAGAFGTTGSVVLCIVFVLVSTVVPYVTYTLGLKNIENGQASIIASIEPVIATLNGIIWFKEKLSVGTIFGVALVLSGIIICNLYHKNEIK
jgi:drug/metabolite transporter (DMT)-like permease